MADCWLCLIGWVTGRPYGWQKLLFIHSKTSVGENYGELDDLSLALPEKWLLKWRQVAG